MTVSKEKSDLALDDISTANGDFLEVVPDRGHWSGRFDFILACLGTAVGLGNVWRFPYLCYKNGGGAFVIPYIIMVFIIGLPVFLLELSLGQYSALGPLKLFNSLSPLFKGIGYSMIIVSAMVAIYYNMIIAWTLFYFFDSFRSDVLWKLCSHDFNTNACFDDLAYARCKESNESNVFLNRTCFNASYALESNLTDIPKEHRISAAEEYLNYNMLGKSDSFENYGNVQWHLVLCLLAAWVAVVLSLIKGIKTSGKVVYFTATFPYVILIILFIRGVTLEGAANGIYFYVVPDFKKLYDVNVWKDAAIQVFYSFSIGGGGMITYASYNKFKNNLIKDVLIIGIGDMLTSLFSGLVVFSMLGFMALQLNKDVSEVVNEGTGLAFIAYPDAISRMPISPLWALLFFFMLFLLGIDSQFAMVETLITFVFDKFPSTRAKKPLVVILVGLALFLLGLPLTANGGIYLFDVMDNYAAGWPYLFIGFIELIIVAYVYGITKYMCDLKEMTGWSPNPWTRSHLLVTVMTISPVVIAMLLLLSWVTYKPLETGKYVFPMWGNAIGWMMAIIPILPIPLMAFSQMLFKHKGKSFCQRVKFLIQPTNDWRANAVANSRDADTNIPRSITMNTVLNGSFGYDNAALDVNGTSPHAFTLSHL